MAKVRHSYVRFFPSDWLGGTSRMTRLHRSVYFDVCLYNWDKALPCPASELPLMLGDLPNWRDIMEDLIAAGKLDRSPDGSVASRRALDEAQHAFDLWERKSIGGRKGAQKTNNSGSGGGSPDGSADRSPDGIGAGVPSQNQNQNQKEGEIEGFTNIERTREADVDDAFPLDLIEFTQDCCAAGGVPHSQPGRIIANQAIVRAWREAGIPDALITSTIRTEVTTATEGISALRYYDRSVRTAHAQQQAREGSANGSEQRLSGNRPVSLAAQLRAAREDEERAAEDQDHDPGTGTEVPAGASGCA